MSKNDVAINGRSQVAAASMVTLARNCGARNDLSVVVWRPAKKGFRKTFAECAMAIGRPKSIHSDVDIFARIAGPIHTPRNTESSQVRAKQRADKYLETFLDGWDPVAHGAGKSTLFRIVEPISRLTAVRPGTNNGAVPELPQQTVHIAFKFSHEG